MKRGDYQCKVYNHITCIKWYDNKSVMLLGNHLEEITSISTVERRFKGSSSKILVNCPNGITLYNSKMVGVDLMNPCQTSKMNLFAKTINGYKGKFKTLSNIWDGAFSESCYRLKRQIRNLAKPLRWSFL